MESKCLDIESSITCNRLEPSLVVSFWCDSIKTDKKKVETYHTKRKRVVQAVWFMSQSLKNQIPNSVDENIQIISTQHSSSAAGAVCIKSLVTLSDAVL